MRILLDTCVWGGARSALSGAGHDVLWTGEWTEDPGDSEILAFAQREQRVLVTLDKDFAELAIVRGVRHHGIVRLVNIAAREQGPFCAWILDRHGEELLAGALITGERGRLRIRPPETG